MDGSGCARHRQRWLRLQHGREMRLQELRLVRVWPPRCWHRRLGCRDMLLARGHQWLRPAIARGRGSLDGFNGAVVAAYQQQPAALHGRRLGRRPRCTTNIWSRLEGRHGGGMRGGSHCNPPACLRVAPPIHRQRGSAWGSGITALSSRAHRWQRDVQRARGGRHLEEVGVTLRDESGGGRGEASSGSAPLGCTGAGRADCRAAGQWPRVAHCGRRCGRVGHAAVRAWARWLKGGRARQRKVLIGHRDRGRRRWTGGRTRAGKDGRQPTGSIRSPPRHIRPTHRVGIGQPRGGGHRHAFRVHRGAWAPRRADRLSDAVRRCRLRPRELVGRA